MIAPTATQLHTTVPGDGDSTGSRRPDLNRGPADYEAGRRPGSEAGMASGLVRLQRTASNDADTVLSPLDAPAQRLALPASLDEEVGHGLPISSEDVIVEEVV